MYTEQLIPLDFSFKGQRNYIQGADIYNKMIEQIKRVYCDRIINKIRLVFHKLTNKQCQMLIRETDDIIQMPKNAIAELNAKTNAETIISWLIETDKVITNRYEYNEGIIESLCDIDKNIIRINGDSGYSPMEVVVSMTKQLHYNLISINNGRWIFTMLELNRLFEPADKYSICVCFKHNFNNKLTKSEVFIGGNSIGHIYFSLVKQ